MFTSENIPVYIEGWQSKGVKIGKEKYRGAKLILRIEPLSAALASELGDKVKSSLFNRTDGEPSRTFRSVRVHLKSKSQRIEIRADAELKPSVLIPDAEIEDPVIRETAEGSHLVLRFVVNVPEIGANDLLYLNNAVTEQRFMTFERAKNSLFDEAEAEARRESKDAAPVKRGRKSEDVDLPVDGDSAPATH